jgi:hypothetical protein
MDRERDGGQDHEQLVRQRVEPRAHRRGHRVTPGEVAIRQVRKGADSEHEEREPSRPGSVRAEQHDNDRDQHDASDGKDVRPAQPEGSHPFDDDPPPSPNRKR